jgi:hypothetical protein
MRERFVGSRQDEAGVEARTENEQEFEMMGATQWAH